MYNPQVINPAYVGSRDVLSVVGLHRSQWVGVPGAPRTSTFSVNTPIGMSKKVGLGVSVIHDEIGPVNEDYLSADFSYSIPTSATATLKFGLKATANLFNVNFSDLNRFDTTDTSYSNIDNNINPNVGAGAYYYSDNFYVGLSVPNLLETEQINNAVITGADPISTSQDRMNFYLMGGYVFQVSDAVKFKPATLVKAVTGSPLQVDFSANFLLHERLTLGAAYRWSSAFSFLTAFQISDSLMIGMSYDNETTDIQEHTIGSFEVMLRFELYKKYTRMLTPRFF